MLDFFTANFENEIEKPEQDFLGRIDSDDVVVLDRFEITNSNLSNQLSCTEEQCFDVPGVNCRLDLAVNTYGKVQNSTCIKSESVEKYIEILKKASIKKVGVKILVVT